MEGRPMDHSGWVVVPAEPSYWHPGNRGFTSTSAEFRCQKCSCVQEFETKCPFCGKESRILGRATGLPGIFCENCREGTFVWDCPACNTRQRLHLAFYYNPNAHTVAKQSGCFIATACSGVNSPEVRILSRFRDEILVPHRAGQQLIDIYEIVSPPVAGFIRSRPIVGRILLVGVIRPLVLMVKTLLRFEEAI
ncbi:MAG TPA: CFI-box-CTERM domain-containing protein [Gemmata sp.]|nr:CFI-box-CTERM domain-containing protein [Gemmata sp.]